MFWRHHESHRQSSLSRLWIGQPAYPKQTSFCLQGAVGHGAAAKFQALSQILQLGYAVLLSDLDVVTIQSPFRHLHRDADLEAASDGFTNATAYGACLQTAA